MTDTDTRTPLPSGGWLVLRDPLKVTERYRRPITSLSAQLHLLGIAERVENGEAASKVGLDPAALALMSSLNDAVAVAMIESWSHEFAVTADSVLDLPGGDYDAVRRITAPFVVQLLPSFAPSPDPESPTAPSQP